MNKTMIALAVSAAALATDTNAAELYNQYFATLLKWAAVLKLVYL